MNTRHLTALVGLFALAGTSLAPARAEAISYTANYMNSWNGCSCAASPLSYTDDQINLFDSKMASLGHTLAQKYANGAVWAGDLVEDTDFGGQDHLYSDDSVFYAFSGHGDASPNAWGQTFYAPMCFAGANDSCWYDSEESRLGEQAYAYAAPNPGLMRYMMWLTCYSVHDAPDQQWGQSFWFGLDYVMGYRGLSADAWTTDEVPEDFAQEAFANNNTFKSAWFYAVEDWWEDDTGSLIAAGTDSAAAASRRDWLSRFTPQRTAGEIHTWTAWSWHEG